MLLLTLIALTMVMLSNSQKMGAKINRVPSTISNSIVNLGSMDLHIHVNSPNQDLESLAKNLPIPDISPMLSKSEECMCNRMKNKMLRDRDSILSNPSEIINKIFSSNDIFSPISSNHCCEQEQTVIVDHVLGMPGQMQMPSIPLFQGPKRNFRKGQERPGHFNLSKGHFPPLPPQAHAPFPFDFLLPSPDKSNTVELFFFPSKKGLQIPKERAAHTHTLNHLKTKPEGIQNIQIVGDKEPRNDFKDLKVSTTTFVPEVKGDIVADEKKSVKKDLNVQQNLEKATDSKTTPRLVDLNTI